MELKEDEEVDDGYYENNDLYNFREYLEEENYNSDDDDDDDDYEDEDENNDDVIQYELLLKDAKICGFNDVNPESIKILRDFIFEYIKLNNDIIFLIDSYIITLLHI